MPEDLRVLLVEDSADDAELVLRALKRGGYSVTLERVDTGAAMEEALGRGPWDVVISDHAMPRFDSHKALAVARRCAFGIPFIIVSGTIGEEAAVEAMRSGADDYVMKSHLARLGPAVERAIRDAGARRALREAQERLGLVVTGAPIVLWAVDTEGVVTLSEGRGLEGFGVRPGELVGRSVEELYPDRPELAELYRRALAGAHVEFSTEMDGRHYETRLSPLRDEKGAVTGAVGVTHDISERVRAEQALRESEERFRRLAENAEDLIYRYRLAEPRGFEYVSPVATRMTGYTPEEHYADPDLGLKIVHPDDRKILEAYLGDPAAWQRVAVMRWTRKDGSVLWTEQRNVPIRDEAGHVVALEGISRDITERVRADQALRESEERLRVTIANSQAIAFGQDRDLRITWVANPGYGFTAEGLIGKTDFEVLLPDEAAAVAAIKRRVIKTGKGARQEVRLTLGGRSIWFDLAVEPSRDAAGKISGVSNVAVDVTGLKRAEEAARESGERYRSLFEGGPDAVAVFDSDSRIVMANRVAAELYGYGSPAEMIGVHSDELVAPEDLEAVSANAISMLSEGGFQGAEYLALKKDGTRFNVESSARIILDAAGNRAGFIGISRDVTDRVRATEALRESEERYRDLVEDINDIVFALDIAGKVTYISPVVEQLGDYKPAEVIGRPFTDFVHPDDVAGLIGSFQKVVSGNQEPSEYRLLMKSGEARWVRSSSRPIKDGERYAGLRGVLSDITERKVAEEALLASQTLLAQTFSSLDEAVLIGDVRTRRFVDCNPAAERIFGYPREELVGHAADFLVADRQAFGALRLDLLAALDADGVFHTEYEMRRKDGIVFPAEVTATGVRDAAGERILVVTAIRDITDRRLHEEALRKETEFTETAINAVPGIFYVFSQDGRFVRWNRRMEEVSGYSGAEIAAMSPLDLIAEEDRAVVAARIAQVFAEGEAGVEAGFLTWSGTVIPFLFTGLRFESDGQIYLAGVGFDITERRLAEEALRASEERYRVIIENVRDIIYKVAVADDPMAAQVVFVSTQAETVLGYAPSEFLADPGLWSNIVHPDDLAAVADTTVLLLATGVPVTREYRLRHKVTGEYRWMEDNVVALLEEGRLAGLQGVARDVTERKLVEQALRESEERFSKAFHSSSSAIVITDARDGRIVDINERMLELVGYTREEVIGRTTLEIGAWVDPAEREAMARAVSETGHLRDAEYRLRAKSGEIHDVLMSVELIELGREPRLLAMAHDITDRKLVENALRQSEERFRTLVETAVDVVFTLARDGRITSLNAAFETVTGWKRDDWLGKTFAPLIHAEDMGVAGETLAQVLRGEPPPVYELRILTASGSYIVGEFHITPLREHGTIVGSLGIARDVTERKRQEEERERLLGELERLAHRLLRIQEEERRQVAYDIHDGPAQQMVAADMYLESYNAGREHSEAKDVEDYLARAKAFLASAIKDTRRIMSDLRPSVLDDLGLVPAMRQYLEETGERTDRKITLSGKLGEERLDPALEIAVFRITQEAVTNAIKHSDSERINVTLKKSGVLVSLEVRDWGAGFDPESAARNEDSDQHGMGLVSMRERAELLGGHFEIESAPGFGTIIKVTIPVSERL